MGNKDIECAYIKVNLIRKSPMYEQNGSARSHQQDYVVRINNIKRSMNIIITVLGKYGINCSESVNYNLPAPASVVYVSSFDWVTESSINNEDTIIDKTIAFAKRIIAEEKNNIVETDDNQLDYSSRRK